MLPPIRATSPSPGAVGCLAGRSGRYYLRSTAVTLGRATDTKGDVDVDLAPEEAAAAAAAAGAGAGARRAGAGAGTGQGAAAGQVRRRGGVGCNRECLGASR